MIIQIGKNKNNIRLNKIAIDTNILLWTFYSNATLVESYQKNIYPNFLSKAIENKTCSIYTTTYNITELYNVIEKTEYELYLKNNNLSERELSRKQYRDIYTERKKIQRELKVIYDQISNCINIEEYVINKNFLNEYQKKYDIHRYDVFDFSLIRYCQDNGINNILTDDKDFCSYKEILTTITILTANKNMI